MKLRLVTAIVIFSLAIISFFYFFWKIDTLKYLPKKTICPFRLLTGYKCPGCGMTHAFIHISQLKLKTALEDNIFSIPLFLLMFYFSLTGKTVKTFYNTDVKNFLIVIILSFWILRILFNF